MKSTFISVLPGFTEFFFWISSGFYGVSLDFTMFYRVFLALEWILPSFIRFSWVFTESECAFTDSILAFISVLPGFTEFFSGSRLDLTAFHLVSYVTDFGDEFDDLVDVPFSRVLKFDIGRDLSFAARNWLKRYRRPIRGSRTCSLVPALPDFVWCLSLASWLADVFLWLLRRPP